MPSHFCLSCLARLFAVGLSLSAFALVPQRAISQNTPSPIAPTATEDPAKIDQAWQKASAKYDAQRAGILKEVDRVDYTGPFPPRLGIATEI